MKPGSTTSRNTRTARSFDLHVASAGCCATSCSRAGRESLIKSQAAEVAIVSNIMGGEHRANEGVFRVRWHSLAVRTDDLLRRSFCCVLCRPLILLLFLLTHHPHFWQNPLRRK